MRARYHVAIDITAHFRPSSHFLSVVLLPTASSLPIEGLLLVGGASERFGRDKRYQDIDGQYMVARAMATLGAICARINVSIASEEGAVPIPDGFRTRVSIVQDERRVGPLGGMEAVWKERGTAQLILAGDLPALMPSTLERLLTTATDAEADVIAVRAKDSGRVQPLCAVWKAPALTLVSAYLDKGGRSVFGLLEGVTMDAIDVPDRELININRPGDLDLLTRM